MAETSMLDQLVPINPADPLPRHVQVQQALEKLISSGRLRPGDKIPAETVLAAAFGVSKMTVNKAILALTAAGQFVREIGRGTFVSNPPRPLPSVNRAWNVMVAVDTVKSSIAEDYYYGPLYLTIQDLVQQAGGTVSLAHVTDGEYLEEQAARRADGWLILAPSRRAGASLAALYRQGVPTVILGARREDCQVPSVDSDNRQGSRLAVEHLAALGHARILLVYAEPQTANTQDRRRGYRESMRALGLPHRTDDEVQAQAGWTLGDAGRSSLSGLLTASARRPTAIYAAGFYLSLEVLSVVRALGLRIPEDVSLVGFDDPLSAQLLYPPLTTVRQPLSAMAEQAVALLRRQMSGVRVSETPSLLPTTLVVRSSTAPCAPGGENRSA